MGFGGLFKKQNQLTDLSNSLSLQAGSIKQGAANKEADALRGQGDLAYAQTQAEKALFQREAAIAKGVQTEQYLNGGVLMAGTPVAVTNETANLAKFKLDQMEQQGTSIQNLLRARADITEQGGLSDLLTAQAGTKINSMQNDINQQETIGSFYRSLFGGIATSGLSILGGLV